MIVVRHAAHPIDPTLLLCGRPVIIANDSQATTIVDVGHQVSCPDCRTVINFCRRCISPSGFVCTRAA